MGGGLHTCKHFCFENVKMTVTKDKAVNDVEELLLYAVIDYSFPKLHQQQKCNTITYVYIPSELCVYGTHILCRFRQISSRVTVLVYLTDRSDLLGDTDCYLLCCIFT